MKSRYLTIISFVLSTLIYSCSSHSDFEEQYIDNLKNYKDKKDVLLKNKDSIIKSVNYHEYDSTRQIDNHSIFCANDYYFKNTILKKNPSIKDLTGILDLWNSKLIENNGDICFDNRDIIIFTVKIYSNYFPTVVKHQIVYDPRRHYISELNANDKHRQLEKDWYYIIKKEYTE